MTELHLQKKKTVSNKIRTNKQISNDGTNKYNGIKRQMK